MTSSQSIGVDVNTATESVTFVTNTVMHVLQRIAHKRNLDPGYLQGNFQVLENGFRTWLTEGKLKGVLLQVYQPGTGQAIENWRTVFEYRAEPDAELRKPPIEHVEEFCASLQSLPHNATYTIYAEVAPDATRVDGWTSGRPLPIFGKTRKDFVKWGYGNIDAGLEYEGSE